MAKKKKPEPIDDPAIAAQVATVLGGIGSDDAVVEPGGITRAMVRMNPHLYPHIKL